MGRRPVGPEVSARMPPRMIEALDELVAQRPNLTRSHLIRAAVAAVYMGSFSAKLLAAAVVVERFGRSLPPGSRRDRVLDTAHDLRREARRMDGGAP